MPELSEVTGMLEAALRAATGGDLKSADELLRGAARIQEAELGPFHPDLANTLNNLAIVAEKMDRPSDAEAFYRRASAIASASLPADHPMVVDSRRNLEDFCRARGVAIDPMAGTTVSASDAALGLDAFPPEEPSVEEKRPVARAVTPPRTAHIATPTPEPAAPRTQRPMPAQSMPAPTRKLSRALVWVIGAVVVVAALLAGRQWSSRAAPPAEPLPTPPAAVATPIEQAQPSKVTPLPPPPPLAERPSTGGVSVIARLCQTFSTSDESWKCEPAGDPVSPGRIVLYTRVKSARDSAVVHRWYRGDSVQQSVKLTIRANATEGYRTYSRQTVDSGEKWRVEVRSAAGDLLYEQQFAVR
jgi:Protein of unknown function (DUF2914)/Tetratricopeptide repeat